VVTTRTLRTIADVSAALEEMGRVLKPSGRLLFVEHGQAPDANVRRWQDRLTPVWRRVGGGCHLNRPIRDLIVGARFRIEQIETGYMRGPKPMTFTYSRGKVQNVPGDSADLLRSTPAESRTRHRFEGTLTVYYVF
jgi:hypothetical protein